MNLSAMVYPDTFLINGESSEVKETQKAKQGINSIYK